MNNKFAGTFALTALAVVLAGFTQGAYAQYGVEGSPIAGATPAQLEECEQLGISKAQCNENAILSARKGVIVAENIDNPDKGSGTNYFSGAETWAYMGILGAIFGGVAATFFFRGRAATPPS